MCDYSLHGIQNRLAVEGEVLTVHRFQTGSKGLTSQSYLDAEKRPKNFITLFSSRYFEPTSECAVCIPDGAELVMTGISPAFQLSHEVSATEVVIFRQLSEEDATHRDAVEFRNGMFVSLQELEEGQRVGVLALSAAETILRKEALESYIVV